MGDAVRRWVGVGSAGYPDVVELLWSFLVEVETVMDTGSGIHIALNKF